MVEQTTKIELEFNEEELEMIDEILVNKGLKSDEKTKYRIGVIKSIINITLKVRKLSDIHMAHKHYYDDYVEKLHKEIKQYQDDIKQYQSYIDKCHEIIEKYHIENNKYTRENRDNRIQLNCSNDFNKYYQEEIKKLEEENSKLKKEPKSPKVTNNKKPIEMKKENIKLKKEPESPKVTNNKKPIEMAVSAK